MIGLAAAGRSPFPPKPARVELSYGPTGGQPRGADMNGWTTVRKTTKRVVLVSLLVYFVPKVLLFYVVCGILDVSRNGRPRLATLERYFLGNGVLTWILSPFNLLMDLLTVPYWNRGVYDLSDLPESYQAEIGSLLESVQAQGLVERVAARLQGQNRAMIFFKWYGRNVKTSIELPELSRDYKHIRTIGVSVFNKQESTSEHFGPLRVTLRMLYNLNAMEDPNAYLEVKNQIHRWSENRLLIFDDTLLHKSCNLTDSLRYCLFVDLLRPSPFPRLMDAILRGVRLATVRMNFAFYKNWEFIT